MNEINQQLEALRDLIGRSEGIIYPAERITIKKAYKALKLNPDKRYQIPNIASNLRGAIEIEDLYRESGHPRDFITKAKSILEKIAETR